jgi:hypothetical protein
MPDDNSSDKPEWSAENLTQVLSDLYEKAVSDRELRDRLMSDPQAVLEGLIEIPDEYRGKIVAQDRTAKILVLNVPPFDGATESIEGTSAAGTIPDYLICTTDTEW